MPVNAPKIIPGKGIEGIPLGGARDQISSSIRLLIGNDPSFDSINHELIISDLGAVLQFDETDSLRLIRVDHEGAALEGVCPIGKRLHEVLALFGKAKIKPVCWRTEEIWSGRHSAEPQPAQDKIPDEVLLQAKILWFTNPRFALKFHNGFVREILICEEDFAPEDGPLQVTASQLELSKRPDLENYLYLYRPRRPFDPISAALVFLLLAALGGLAWQGFKLDQHWRSSKHETLATVVERREYPKTSRCNYLLKYKLPSGAEQEKLFSAQDFYVPPEPASEVSLFYLPESPADAKTQTDLENIGFNHAAPRMIAALAVFAVLMIVRAALRYLWTAGSKRSLAGVLRAIIE